MTIVALYGRMTTTVVIIKSSAQVVPIGGAYQILTSMIGFHLLLAERTP
jgi:hypothetical protein